MGKMPWVVYLWPGLPLLWRRGAWRGLAVALGFAALVNLALMISIVWSELELFGPPVRNAVWMVVVLVWLGSAVLSLAGDSRQPPRDRLPAESDVFAQAIEYALGRDWYEAQRVLGRLLQADSRDVDARLMLATVLRHSGRLEDAAGQLDRLVLIEGSRKWEQEIDRERKLLAEAATRNRDEFEPDDVEPGAVDTATGMAA